MIKTVTCITYSALILLSIIILWCVFSSTVESFGDKCYSSGGSTCPSPKTPTTPDTPTTPECNEDSPDSPDSPDDDELLCPNAPSSEARTKEWTSHQGKGCQYFNDPNDPDYPGGMGDREKGENRCKNRHVVYDNGDMKWCRWDNGRCFDGGLCGAVAEENNTSTVAASPAPSYTCVQSDTEKYRVLECATTSKGCPSASRFKNNSSNEFYDKTKVSTCTALPEADCNNSYVQTKGEYNMADYYSAYDQAWRYGAHKRDNVSKCKWVAED